MELLYFSDKICDLTRLKNHKTVYATNPVTNRTLNRE